MASISPSKISAISRLFSSAVVKEFACLGKSPLFARLANEILDKDPDTNDKVSHFLEEKFKILKKFECRHEYIYKAALTQRILLGRHSLRTASMLNEFRVGECKADVAILNGTATVYEIKSERDSLSRLERQIETYRDFFAKVYVIAGDNHIDNIRSIVSSDVGIMRLSARGYISSLREAKEDSNRTSPVIIFDSIRIEEAKRILTLLDFSIPDVPNTEIHAVLKEQFAKLNASKVHEAMVYVLKQTRNLQPLSNLVAKLPTSLHSAALSVPIRRGDHERLMTAVNVPLITALQWS